MSNIKPKTPSFVFGYWRPWKEDSKLIDSYLDYVRDTSLVKYGADTIGKYINFASKEQVHVINRASNDQIRAIGRASKEQVRAIEQASRNQVEAINKLGEEIGRGLNILSNQMNDINNTLFFINRNIDIQIEHQKVNNLLLQNISELLRVPDSEKERQHCIELGLKFFVNGSMDPDLYSDALEELTKAESLMKQDYFVLHRIGCIYLYVEKFINPEKAIDYFLRAAKYASVESDRNAVRLVNVLSINFNTVNSDLNNSEKSIGLLAADSFEKAAFAAYVTGLFSDAVIYQSKALKYNDILQNRFLLAKYQVRNGNIAEGIENLDICIEREPMYALACFKEIDLINESEVINLISQKNRKVDYEINKLLDKLNTTKSSFATNMMMDLSMLLNKSYEIKVSTFASLEQVFQANQNIDSEIGLLLNQLQNINSDLANDLVSNLLDLSNKSYESKLTDFVSIKQRGLSLINKIDNSKAKIDSKIDSLIELLSKTTYRSLDSDSVLGIIDELHKAKHLPFESMEKIFNSAKERVDYAKYLENKIVFLESEIDSFISELWDKTFCTIDVNKFVNELIEAKKLSFEEMKDVFDRLKKQASSDELKIGSIHAGGIVFYIDRTGMHGLVCAELDFGNAVWGGSGLIGTTDGGIGDDYVLGANGMQNTIKIVDEVSWFIKAVSDGWFSKKQLRTPAPTAARLCLESNHNGFSDWYLPTRRELEVMYESLKKKNLGDFQPTSYWSSSEDDANFAFCFPYPNPLSGKFKKNSSAFVRAVRAF
jgi:hypothetical protein